MDLEGTVLPVYLVVVLLLVALYGEFQAWVVEDKIEKGGKAAVFGPQ